MITEILVLILTVFLVAYIFNWIYSTRNLPPGPQCYPLIGSLISMAKSSKPIHKTLTEMAKTYGDIFTLYLPTSKGCQPTIVINSYAEAHDALVTQKDTFSGRPYLFTQALVQRGGEGLGFSDFTNKTILLRKVVHKALRLYQPHLEKKILDETDDIVKMFQANGNTPFNPKSDLSYAAMNVIFAITYGKRFNKDDEEILELINSSSEVGKFLSPLNILNLFPWLINFSFGSTRRLCAMLEDRFKKRLQRYLEEVRTFKENEIRHLVDALVKAKLDEQTDSNCDSLTDIDFQAVLNSLFGAGSDTSATTLTWLIAYILNFPEIQQRLYSEILEVFGEDGKIELKRRNECHFLEATLAEVLRHASITPLFAHKATCNTTLGGYRVPKDTTVILNIWAINHDERQWENPQQFNPDRFLDSKGKFTGTMKKSYMPFGAGRRVCIGESMAKQEIFLISASLLQKFEFENPPGCHPPDLNDGILGITYAPKTCMVIARQR